MGGPRSYEGRRLREAHRYLPISDHPVDLVAEDLAAVLAGLGVSPALLDEVVAAVDGLRDTCSPRQHRERRCPGRRVVAVGVDMDVVELSRRGPHVTANAQ